MMIGWPIDNAIETIICSIGQSVLSEVSLSEIQRELAKREINGGKYGD